MSYSERDGAVDVDLRRPGAGNGAADEGDALANVERLEGGNGDDRLAADNGPNLLLGGDGIDTLEARGGTDLLNGGPGRDVFNSGPGDDRLEPADDEGDDLRFGSGTDTFTHLIRTGDYEAGIASVGPDAADVVRPDCGLALRSVPSPPSLVSRSSGAGVIDVIAGATSDGNAQWREHLRARRSTPRRLRLSGLAFKATRAPPSAAGWLDSEVDPEEDAKQISVLRDNVKAKQRAVLAQPSLRRTRTSLRSLRGQGPGGLGTTARRHPDA